MHSKFAIPYVLTSIACSLGVGCAHAAPATIVLGTSVQITGAEANTGHYYRDAEQFMIDRINSAGGVKVDGKTYELALKLYDNQSDINLSVRQYTQLVSHDKVNFLLGGFASNYNLADSAISEKYRIPMVTGGGASDQIFSRGFKYIFGTLPSAGDYFGSTVSMLKKLKPAPKNLALIYADDAFDVAVAKGTRSLLKATDLHVVMDQKYSNNASDFNSVLSNMKAENTDAILVAGHETEILNFIRQAKSLNINPKIYSFTVGVPSHDFRKALDKDANYAFGMSSWIPNTSLKDKWFGDANQFSKAYQTKFGYLPDYHAAAAAASVEALAVAIEKANSLDPQKVRDEIASSNFDSLLGKIVFDNKGQISLDQTVVQIQNGELKPVFNGSDFLSKIQYPMPSWSSR